jgi:prephenate dehydratase
MRVHYLGIQGSYAHQAAQELYPEHELIAHEQIYDAFAIQDGILVVPIENTSGGPVRDVESKILTDDSWCVIGEHRLPINHYLLTRRGDRGRVSDVWSHPQALYQCQEYLNQCGIRGHADLNTAVSARRVAAGEIQAAIASAYAAKVWDLQKNAEPIQDHDGNTTRFWALSKGWVGNDFSDGDGPRLCSIIFTLPNKPGSLRKALSIIEDSGYNLSRLESRPQSSSQWEYDFVADIEIDSAQDPEKLLILLRSVVISLRVLGIYQVRTG